MDGSHLWSFADTPITRMNPSRSASRRRRVAKRSKKPNGYVLYEGPSMLDGAPIVVIATGFKGSDNKKTGSMVQTWILRADIDPTETLQRGADTSICGDCPHRGHVIETPITRAYYRDYRKKHATLRKHGTAYREEDGSHVLRKSKGRACYVVIAQAPLTIWRAWRQGIYPAFNASTMPLEGRILRMGSYGDPVAVPPEVWLAALSAGVEGFTGYTHQWRLPHAQRYSEFLMASVDSPEEAAQAESMGWRYFRVRGEHEPLIAGREIMCPASTEYKAKTGKKVTCAECLMCSGQRSRTPRSVSIIAHGSGAKYAGDSSRRLPRANPRVGGSEPRGNKRLREIEDMLRRLTPSQIVEVFDVAGVDFDDFSGASLHEMALALYQSRCGGSADDTRENPGDDRRRTLERLAAQGDPSAAAALAASRARTSPRVEGRGKATHVAYLHHETGEPIQTVCGRPWSASFALADWPNGNPTCRVCFGLRRSNPGDDEIRRLERELTYGDPSKIAALRAAQARRGVQSGVYENMIAALGPSGMPRKGFAGMTVGGARLMIEAWLRSFGWRPDYNARRGMLTNDVWISEDEQRRAVFGKKSMRFEIGGRGSWQRDKSFEASLGKDEMGELYIKQAAQALLPPPGG